MSVLGRARTRSRARLKTQYDVLSRRHAAGRRGFEQLQCMYHPYNASPCCAK